MLQPVPGLVGRVPAAAAALALPLLDDARRACLVEALRILHRHAGFVLVHASGEQAAEPSPFVQAARFVTETLQADDALGAGAARMAAAGDACA